jgi:isoleucyl-tRNA synthetase
MSVYATTYEVLVGVAQLAAPFAPFLTDEMYVKLTGEESVHLSFYPVSKEEYIDETVEARMDLVRQLVGLGRGAREKERIKVRQPLQRILVDGKYEDLIGDMTDLITEELNVKEVVFEKQLDQYMNFGLKPNFKVAGPALGSKIKAFGAALAGTDPVLIVDQLETTGEACLVIDGEETMISKEFVDIHISAKEGFTVSMENNVFTILDTTVTSALISEGLAREMISKIQQMRKQRDFEMMDQIKIYYNADDEVKAAIAEHKHYIMKETLAVELRQIESELVEYDLNGHKTGIDVERI